MADTRSEKKDAARERAEGGHGREVSVRFEAVRFSYGKILVLEGAEFHIHEGEFAVLLGPNGSGKTTILKLILGLLAPDSGRVRVFGERPEEARRSIGYVPQSLAFDPAFPVSTERVVMMGRLKGSFGGYGREDAKAAMRAMEEAGITHLARRPYMALSGGQRRRVLVARALASSPRLLVLDEPTSNMDMESESRLFESLGSLKGRTTILIVTHDTSFVSTLTDSILCVGEGGGRRGIVHHPAVPVGGEAAPKRFGGEVLRVLHESELPEDDCFCGNEGGKGEGEKDE